MPELIISVIITFCFGGALLLRYAPFSAFVAPKQKKILWICYGAVSILNVIAMGGVFAFMGIRMAYIDVDLLVYGFLTVLINILVIGGRAREHLFVYGLVLTCNYLLYSVPLFITEACMGTEHWQDIMVTVILYGALVLLLYLPLRKLVNGTVKPFLSFENGDYWNTIWFIPIAMFLAMFIVFPGNAHADHWYELLSHLLLGFATILMCYSIAADHKRFEEKQAMTEQITLQKIHYAGLQQRVEDARKTNHDFKHHVAVICSYMDNDDKEGLAAYCDSLLERHTEKGQMPYTGNSAADSILYRYIRLCEEQKIEMECQGKIVGPGIADIDLCALLGNALDNALTGCLTLPESAERKIVVASKTEGNLLSVMIQNTFDGYVKKDKDELQSRKRENGVGIGLTSMRSICERYKGSMMVDFDETHFTVMFLLPTEQ